MGIPTDALPYINKHDQKLFKKRFRLDVRKHVFFPIELLIIGTRSLPVALTVALLTLSTNNSRLH